MMRKTILLPTDFSDNARNAYHYAFSLFGADGVRYVLFNAYDVPYSRMDMITKFEDVLADISREGLEVELAYCRDLYPFLDAEITVYSKYGEFSDSLRALVDEMQADYIVMGTKGASGLDKVFVGSNAAKVIQRVNCPTIAVPNDLQFTTPKQLAFAADYTELTDKIVLPLRHLLDITNAELLIFNIQSDATSATINATNMANLEHPALQGIPQRFVIVNESDVVEGIETFVSEHKIDMLVMVAWHHNFFERLFHRSITKQIALELEKLALFILHD